MSTEEGPSVYDQLVEAAEEYDSLRDSAKPVVTVSLPPRSPLADGWCCTSPYCDREAVGAVALYFGGRIVIRTKVNQAEVDRADLFPDWRCLDCLLNEIQEHLVNPPSASDLDRGSEIGP